MYINISLLKTLICAAPLAEGKFGAHKNFFFFFSKTTLESSKKSIYDK